MLFSIILFLRKLPINERTIARRKLTIYLFRDLFIAHPQSLKTLTLRMSSGRDISDNKTIKFLPHREGMKPLSHTLLAALPCLEAQTNASTEGLLKFVSAYEGSRPDISPDLILSKLPCTKKYHLSEKVLATEIWGLVIRRSLKVTSLV